MHWVRSTHPSSSSVFVCRKWMSCCCCPSYTAWLISRGKTTSIEPCLSPRHLFHRMGPFCNRWHIKHCLEPSFSSSQCYNDSPFCFFCFFIKHFFSWSLKTNWWSKFTVLCLQIHKSSYKRVFLSMLLYRDMQYLQKKKEKKNYYLKINVPKVTMLCKWPLIYVWILAIPLLYPLEY